MISIIRWSNVQKGFRYSFAFILMMLTMHVQAEDQEKHKIWIDFGGTSWHFNGNKDRNAANYGLGIEYGINSDSALVAGVYKNSFYNYSRYAGISWMPVELGMPQTKVGIVIGGADGYGSINNGGWFPFLAPALSFEAQRFGFNLIFMPPANSKLRGALALQFKVRY